MSDEKGLARKSKGLFLRLDVDFLMNDPRCVLMDDSEFRIYCQLSGIGLQCRRELLPSRFTVRSISMIIRRDPTEVGDVIDRLCHGEDPLVGVEDGRIRIHGLKTRYDGRFVWKPDAEQLQTTRSSCKQLETTAADVDVDTDVDVDVQDAHASSPMPELPAPGGAEATAGIAHVSADGNSKDKELPPLHPKAAEILSKWQEKPNDFGRWVALTTVVKARADVEDVLAHLLDLDGTDFPSTKKASMMWKRMYPKGPAIKPGENARREAKKIMNEDLEQIASELPALGIGAAAKKGKPAAVKKKEKKA